MLDFWLSVRGDQYQCHVCLLRFPVKPCCKRTKVMYTRLTAHSTHCVFLMFNKKRCVHFLPHKIFAKHLFKILKSCSVYTRFSLAVFFFPLPFVKNTLLCVFACYCHYLKCVCMCILMQNTNRMGAHS